MRPAFALLVLAAGCQQKISPDPTPALPASSAAEPAASAGAMRREPAPEASASRGDVLTAAELTAGIATVTPAIRRTCWERALAAHPGKTPPRLRVEFEVAPAGQVTRAKASGGSDYPGLEACVEQQLKKATFAQARAPTTATFPLVFAVN